MQFEARLRQLRERAQRRSESALTTMRLSGLLLIAWSLLLVAALFLHLFDWGTDGAPVLWALPAGALGLSCGLILLLRGGRLFEHHYRRAWQALLYSEDGQLFADDERLRIIQARLPGLLWWVPPARQPFNLLTDRIEFCAFHLPGLRRLTQFPDRPGWWTLRLAENARLFARQLDHGGLVFVGCFFGLFLPVLHAVLAVWGLVVSPRVITAYARLVAFIDSYLEEPRIVLENLQVVKEKGYLAELAAAWSTQPTAGSREWADQ